MTKRRGGGTIGAPNDRLHGPAATAVPSPRSVNTAHSRGPARRAGEPQSLGGLLNIAVPCRTTLILRRNAKRGVRAAFVALVCMYLSTACSNSGAAAAVDAPVSCPPSAPPEGAACTLRG